jgi:hypothetical protein
VEPKHVITQLVGAATAVPIVRWGWKEFRRDWAEERRLPLVTGPYLGGRTVLLALGAVAAVVAIVMAIIELQLIPKDSPVLFVAMLVWLSLAFVFGLLGAASIQSRRSAKGWIYVVGDDSLRIDTDGASATLKLRPGTARLRSVHHGRNPQYVQLDLDDGVTRAQVWGMVGIRELKMVGPEARARPQGLMVATSMSPLCRWLAPYLTKG